KVHDGAHIDGDEKNISVVGYAEEVGGLKDED
ncbi:MAG: hypothetical protein RR583_08125, partial [Enterococcus sp.]